MRCTCTMCTTPAPNTAACPVHGGHTRIANNPPEGKEARPPGPALALWQSQDGSSWFQQS